MNYLRIYNELVDRAKQRNKPNCYTEKHHIIPKSEGGTDCNSNLVDLTAREHFIAHKLLWMDNPHSFSRAATYHMMSNYRNIKWGITYEEARKVFIGENHPLKQSENRIKQLEAVVAKPKTIEHRNKIAEALRGKPKTKESIEKMKANLGDRSGKNNANYGKGKSIIGDGVEYKNAREAALATNTSPQNIFYRLNSKKWNWNYKDLDN
jgi:hypothetical protein